VSLETRIIKIDPKKPNEKILRKIAGEIKKGEIVVYPTETCYGLGTNALKEDSVKRVYEIKRRPLESNITVIVDSLKTAKKYGKLNKTAEKLARKFMPGPLTLIVERRKNFPEITNKDFAFRISSNPIAFKLASYCKVPITATSANLHGKQPIYSGKEAIRTFAGKVDIILNAGNLKKMKPSTILSVKNKEIKIIRKGPIPMKKIASFL